MTVCEVHFFQFSYSSKDSDLAILLIIFNITPYVTNKLLVFNNV